MRSLVRNLSLHAVALLLLASAGMGQGIETKRGTVILFGSDSNCSQPATIDHRKVQRATPEWKTIKSGNVQKGTARHDLLTSEMNARIKQAVSRAATAAGRDCVVRKGDIKRAKGLTVVDLTQAVVDELDS